MTQITIPASIEDATSSLNGLGKLLTAKEWERAAIVYAFTHDHEQGQTSCPSCTKTDMSEAKFAAQGIVGLKKRQTVSQYRDAWASTGQTDIKPGDTVTLPTNGWPPGIIDHQRGSHGTAEEGRRFIAEHPEVVAEAVKAVPAVADAVIKEIAASDELSGLTDQARLTRREPGGPKVDRRPSSFSPTIIPDYAYEKEVAKAIRTVNDSLNRERTGEWKPDPGIALMLSVLYLNLKDRAEAVEASRPQVFREIDEFLATSRSEE